VFGYNYTVFVVVQVTSQNKIMVSNTKECLRYVDLIIDRHSCKIYFTNPLHSTGKSGTKQLFSSII
jgi:hypothetical protein